MKFLTSKMGLLILGIIFGLGAVVLAMNGNPANMAICTACFIRDIAGAMKLQQTPVVQYFRPEIVGIIIGALTLSLFRREYQSTGGSSTVIRFFVGALMMICALVFLGCPLRMILRMSSGDISAYMGLLGFGGGVLTGSVYIKKGFSLGQSYTTKKTIGAVFPLIFIGLFALSIIVPEIFAASTKGPGSIHAPWILSLIIGVLIGGIAQFSRLCFSGAVRNVVLLKDFSLLMVIVGLFVVMAIYNIMTGTFAFKSYGPIAHAQTLWNILSMYAVGLAAVLLGGCPLRQLILASSGSNDSAMTVIGMLVGAAFAHNFVLAAAPASASSAGGPGIYGQVAVVFSIVFLLALGFWGIRKRA